MGCSRSCCGSILAATYLNGLREPLAASQSSGCVGSGGFSFVALNTTPSDRTRDKARHAHQIIASQAPLRAAANVPASA